MGEEHQRKNSRWWTWRIGVNKAERERAILEMVYRADDFSSIDNRNDPTSCCVEPVGCLSASK